MRNVKINLKAINRYGPGNQACGARHNPLKTLDETLNWIYKQASIFFVSFREPLPSLREPSPSFREPSPSFRKPSPSVRKPSPSFREPSPSFREPLPPIKEHRWIMQQTLFSLRGDVPVHFLGSPMPVAFVAGGSLVNLRHHSGSIHHRRSGNIQSASGNIHSASGNIQSTLANILSASGNIQSTLAKIQSASGNIQSTLGNIDILHAGP